MKRRLLGILLVGGVAVAGSVLFARQPFDLDGDLRPYLEPENFELTISVDAERYGPDEEPILRAELKNKTARTIYVMRPLDASRLDRAPVVRLAIEMPDGKPAPEWTMWCGFRNPIVPGDLIAIPAGESRYLSGYLIHEVSAGPGVYKVQMAYASGGIREGHIAQGYERDKGDEPLSLRELNKILKRTPRFVVHSNEIEIDVDWPKHDLASLLTTADYTRSKVAMGIAGRDGFTRDEIGTLAAFYLDSLNRTRDPHWLGFMLDAMDDLAEHGDAEVAGQVWNKFALPDTPGYLPSRNRREAFSNSFVELLLKLPEAEREVALRMALAGEGKQKRFTRTGRGIVEMLMDDESPGRTTTLVQLYQQTQPHDVARPLLEKELKRRGVDVSIERLAETT